ncbi:MAG TPA: Ig-like domain repeat protein [Granulicella sp.]|nr:Ig-like domain repeat protein [Granulicella sp.]
MNYRSFLVRLLLVCLVCISISVAQSPTSRIVSPIDGANLVTLTGNTHPLARAAYDQGALAVSTPLNRMQLVLARSAQQEAALKQLLDQQQDRGSSSFHQWLTPQSFGATFGPSDRDLSTVTAWLAAQGFTGIHVSAGRTIVEFSGTAGSVNTAFHTAMHRYMVNGQQYFANASDPRIPAALTPVVAGVASLNNFAQRPALSSSTLPLVRDNKTGAITRAALPATSSSAATAAVHANYTTPISPGQSIYAVTPGDLATIYNITPLGTPASGINGTGQSIAVVGDSDINISDFLSFRNLFGLPIGTATGPTQTQYLNLIYNGADPGITADEIKGDADTQWAGAVATNATIDYVVSQTTTIMQGSDLSAQYIVDNNVAPVLVDSFNNCEANAGAAYNSFINNLWEQAAAQGITAVVSAGDNGSAGCDVVGSTTATGGLAVNATASTPYNVAVGGTDFPGGWNPTNNPDHSSVSGYLPETAWNDNVTGSQIIGPIVSGGGGGVSSCATGAPASGTTASTCAGYARPSWQTGVTGLPTPTFRDVPDVSLFAGDGAYGAFYFVCQQDAVTIGGTPCTVGTPSTDFVGAGGTSISAAAFAGMIALVNQSVAAAQPTPSGGQGNVNYTLYALAAAQQNAGTACTSTGPPANGCVFNDITTGTNQMPCATGALDCSGTSPAGPVLSGYATTPGYDLATGLGSVNAANLVNQWGSVSYKSTQTSLMLNGVSGDATLTIAHGASVTAAGTVISPSPGTPTGQVAIVANAANGAIGTIPLPASGDFSQAFTTFPGSGTVPGTTTPASYKVNAFYSGDGTFAASESIPVNLIVTPEGSTTTLSVLDLTPGPNQNQTVSNVFYGEILDVRARVAGLSGQGTATGNVNFTDSNPSTNNTAEPLYGGVYRLNSSGYADVQTTALGAGPTSSPHSFVAAYDGDNSFLPSTSVPPVLLTINKAPTTAAVAPPPSVSDADTVTLYATISTTGYGFSAPTGSAMFTLNGPNGPLLGSSILIGHTGNNNYDYSTATLTIPANKIPPGSTVTASYGGDNNYLGTSGATNPISIIPSGFPVTTTNLVVTTTPASPLTAPTVPAGGSITMTATVTPTAAESANSAVTFFVDGMPWPTVNPQPVGPLAPNGTVTYTATGSIAAFGPGPHIATAVFSQNPATATYLSSMSLPVPFTITAIGTTGDSITAAINPTTAFQGSQITVTGTVATVPAGGTPPTGTLQLWIDGTIVGGTIPLSAQGTGAFNLVTNIIQPGLHSASVYYSGDATYASGYSVPQPFTINALGNTPTSITISGVPSPVGQGVTFKFPATITPNTTTGSTEVIIDGNTANPQPQAALTGDPTTISADTSSLSLGTHTVQVYFSGNSTLSAATSNTETFEVITPNSGFTLSPTIASAHIPLEGQASGPTTFTVTPTVGGTFSVTFACSSLPQNVTCSFSPATVNLNGLTPATTNLTFVVGSYPQASLHKPSLPGGWYTMGGGVSFAGLFLLLLPRRNRRFASLLAVLTLCALASVTGCGSGIGPEQGPFPVIVTATSSTSVLGQSTQTATVNLTLGGTPTN